MMRSIILLVALCIIAAHAFSLFGNPHKLHDHDHAHFEHGVGSMHMGDASDALCPQFIGPPCPYYFNNTMPDYVPGSPVIIPDDVAVLMEERIEAYADMIVLNAPPGYNDTTGNEYMVYEGHAGRALIFLRLFKLSGDKDMLAQAKLYIDSALQYMASARAAACSFQVGSVGTYAIAAVIYDRIGDQQTSSQYLQQVLIQTQNWNATTCGDDLLIGRAGLIYTGLLLNKVITPAPIPRSLLVAIGQSLVRDGAQLGGGKYLAYNAFGSLNINTAHGASGVLHVLLELDELLQDPPTAAIMLATINSWVSQQYPDGNFPNPGDFSSSNQDVLVQWCFGAPGFIPTLLKAADVFNEQKFVTAAYAAADAVWTRGLITKGMLLCHGIGGNAYSFLQLYRETADLKFLYRAIQFAQFTLDPANIVRMRVPDDPFGFFAGSWAGALFLYSDLLASPEQASMPAFDFDI